MLRHHFLIDSLLTPPSSLAFTVGSTGFPVLLGFLEDTSSKCGDSPLFLLHQPFTGMPFGERVLLKVVRSG